MEFFNFLAKGGIIMIPIGLTSLIGVTAFLYKILTLRQSNIVPTGLTERIIDLIKNNNNNEAVKILNGHSSLLSDLLLVALKRKKDFNKKEMLEFLEEKGVKKTSKLGGGIELVGIMAAISPLLGLLGTVTGMISVFQKVMNNAAVKGVDPGSLAGGIWEALITTAAGLSVSIPLYLAYRYLLFKSDDILNNLETSLYDFTDTIYTANKSRQLEDNNNESEKTTKQ